VFIFHCCFRTGQFPEAICASEFSNELRWISGMFYWTQVVQSHNETGWNYMEKIREISLNESLSGEIDSSFANEVDCILKTGKVNCDVARDTTDVLRETLSALTNFDLPTASPTMTQPTLPPTDLPTSVSAYSLICYSVLNYLS
jgi:hypothetical protein